jgi:hypothetical protein
MLERRIGPQVHVWADVNLTIQQAAKDGLILLVPGEAPLRLSPREDSRLSVSGLPGASLEFINASSGTLTGTVLKLPSDTAIATQR